MRKRQSQGAEVGPTEDGTETPARESHSTPKGIADAAAVWLPIDALEPWAKNPRKNDGRPVDKVAASLRRFGFVAPIVVWTAAGRMVAGHTRLKALRQLLAEDPGFTPRGAPGPGMARVVFADFADEAEANLYALADNRLNELAVWDDAAVAEILGGYATDEVAVAGFDEVVVTPDEADGALEREQSGALADQFGVPPFSVLDARQGYWRERKRAWLALGIASDDGRSENLLFG